MSEKVKVSMFLEPELAQAVKVQAARLGNEGVSGLMRRVFQCAHCGEPIADEFVVGIKLVAPNKFGVLFHSNRKECRAASGVDRRK